MSDLRIESYSTYRLPASVRVQSITLIRQLMRSGTPDGPSADAPDPEIKNGDRDDKDNGVDSQRDGRVNDRKRRLSKALQHAVRHGRQAVENDRHRSDRQKDGGSFLICARIKDPDHRQRQNGDADGRRNSQEHHKRRRFPDLSLRFLRLSGRDR